MIFGSNTKRMIWQKIIFIQLFFLSFFDYRFLIRSMKAFSSVTFSENYFFLFLTFFKVLVDNQFQNVFNHVLQCFEVQSHGNLHDLL